MNLYLFLPYVLIMLVAVPFVWSLFRIHRTRKLASSKIGIYQYASYFVGDDREIRVTLYRPKEAYHGKANWNTVRTWLTTFNAAFPTKEELNESVTPVGKPSASEIQEFVTTVQLPQSFSVQFGIEKGHVVVLDIGGPKLGDPHRKSVSVRHEKDFSSTAYDLIAAVDVAYAGNQKTEPKEALVAAS